MSTPISLKDFQMVSSQGTTNVARGNREVNSNRKVDVDQHGENKRQKKVEETLPKNIHNDSISLAS